MFNRKIDNGRELEITITNRTFLRLAGLTIGLILLLTFVQKAAHALLLIFVAFFLALALNGPVHRISRHLPGKMRGSRTLATTLSFLLVVLLLGIFVASIVPPLVNQTERFAKAAPQIVRDARSQDSQIGEAIRRYNLQDQVDKFSDQLSDRIKNAGGEAFSAAQRVGSSFFSLLTILVLTFMMLIEGPRWLGLTRELVPARRRPAADRIAGDMYRVIRGFVNGQVTLAIIAAVFILPVMLALHISYPIALMVVVFICGLIPMVGHTIGAIIVTFVALFESTSAAIIILTYYILYQQIENYLIQPRIQANSTNMSPLLIFTAVVIGVSFGGLIGGLFAIPIAGCIRIVVLEYLRSRRIIDTEEFKEATRATK